MYITYNFYKNDWKGSQITESEFDRLNMRAEDVIDLMTDGKIKIKGLTSFNRWERLLIQKAVASQIDYYSQYSEDVGFTEADVGFTTGKVSVNAKSSTSKSEKSFISPRTLMYLSKVSGLLLRAVCYV